MRPAAVVGSGRLVDRAEFLSGVLDTVSVGIVACDAAGRLTLFNETARALHGTGEDSSVPPSRGPPTSTSSSRTG